MQFKTWIGGYIDMKDRLGEARAALLDKGRIMY